MRAVLDAPDIEDAVVVECAEGDPVITAACHTPSFNLEP
jgi:hypothetical protein